MLRLLFVSMVAFTVTTTQANPAQVEGWPGGTALIKSYGPDGGLTVGRIDSDGNVVLEMSAPPSTTQTLEQTYSGACAGDGDITAGPPDVAFTPTSLYAEREGEELGALYMATSPELVLWRDSFSQTDAAEGAWYQLAHVTAAAEVTGRCAVTVYTDADANESYQSLTEHKVVFAKGWNLMQNTILALHADATGKRHAQHAVIDVVASMPQTASWYFVEY